MLSAIGTRKNNSGRVTKKPDFRFTVVVPAAIETRLRRIAASRKIPLATLVRPWIMAALIEAETDLDKTVDC